MYTGFDYYIEVYARFAWQGQLKLAMVAGRSEDTSFFELT
jgi:hypothetical protein